ncbi:MAG: HAD family hydrolase [Pseudomonadota bacterium]
MNKAVFFDKDGVLNLDKGFDGKWNNVELYSEAGPTISYLRGLGYKIFVITNQTVIARGLSTEAILNDELIQFQRLLLEQDKKALIDKIYYCPHHPNADLVMYRTNCECRKPKPGMLLKASKEYDLDLKKSYVVGDRISDIIAGHLAGCITVQCLTGQHDEKMIETDLKIKEEIRPEHTIKSLSELRKIILS